MAYTVNKQAIDGACSMTVIAMAMDLALAAVLVGVKATASLNVHAETLTKCSGLNRNKKGSAPLDNPTLPEDLAETVESLAQIIVLRRTLALLYPLNK
jgi:hypothetical protein